MVRASASCSLRSQRCDSATYSPARASSMAPSGDARDDGSEHRDDLVAQDAIDDRVPIGRTLVFAATEHEPILFPSEL